METKIRRLEGTELTTLLALAFQRQTAADKAMKAQQQAMRLTAAMASLAQTFAVVSGEPAENKHDFLWESSPGQQDEPMAWLVRLEEEKPQAKQRGRRRARPVKQNEEKVREC